MVVLIIGVVLLLVAIFWRKGHRWLRIPAAVLGVILAIAGVASSSATAPAASTTPVSAKVKVPTWQIVVSGTPGLKFSGSYGITSLTGNAKQKSVDGTVPTHYDLPSGTVVSVVFQKRTTQGTLTVKILHHGKVVGHSSTTAQYGAVSVASNGL